MTKIDIVSGFLGAGKTTLIKKLLAEAYPGEKLVLIENEFGEINIDGGFLKESGIQISEMSAGCICCSLVGDFNKSLKQVSAQFHPDRILIEPSGVGKLSDVIVAVENTAAEDPELKLNSFVTVADATKVKVYIKNFGEFYNNQIESAGTIILSRTQKLTEEKLQAAVAMLREKNPDAAIITTPWDELDGKTILRAIEKVSLADELLAKMRAEHEAEEAEHHHHHHHDEDEHEHHHHHDHDEDECDDPDCACHHHHDDDEDDHDHEHHHHHDHDHEEHEHHHHHDHDGDECDDPDCCCHDHHHHHHADEVFTSWGVETPKTFTAQGIDHILEELDSGEYGKILRAKGIVNGEGGWLEFDYVPEEHDVRPGHPDYTGRLCVIGAELKEDALKTLFGV
ncbi:MAG: CobW family GTP-binding protein [Dysosmobacter sp.]|nr:CobW family GTP-binding protein [Dysosmobacter sp.]